MAIAKPEGISSIDQISRADIFGIDQKLSRCLAGLGELTVHSRQVFSCKMRNEGGPNLDIKFDGDDCKIFVLDKNGESGLVFPIRDSKSVIVVGKDFVTVK